MHEPTSLASLSATLWEALETHYGVDAAAVFAAAGVDKTTREQRTGRIPASTIGKLWDEAIRVTGDPHIGHVAGRTIRPGFAFALGMAWLASETLDQGLQRQARYFRVLTTFFSMVYEPEKKESRVSIEARGTDQALLPTSADVVLTMTVRFCRLASRDNFAPLRVCFATELDNPTTMARYRAYFRCPVHFGAGENALYFDTETLNAPLPAADDMLVMANEKLLDRYLREMDAGDFSNKVRQALAQSLPSGRVTEEDVAQRLNRSVSSLQRHLRAEGTGYRDILERTREGLAREYLSSGQHPIAEVAYLLGYADQSTFTRAFKRWTGMSPGAYVSEAG